MVATLLIAAALTVQAPVPAGTDRVDVGYEQLVKGQPSEAIARIRANDEIARDDPAALINLGAAYAMMGQKRKAEESYRAAIASDARYDLQLADGRWMDSRRAARIAVEALEQGQTLALR